MSTDVRDERYAKENQDGTVYDCSDEGYVCALITDENGITVCVECGDRPHVRCDCDER